MRSAGLLLFLAIFLVACSPSPRPESAISRPPNVLLILTDDQGWGDLHMNGNDSIDTPVLDRLGAESVRFDRFYVSPVCAPTRASLLTGRYYLRTGATWVTHRREVMRSSEATIAEYLREEGYRTGIFGKWHNGAQYPNDPAGQGFDQFLGFKGGHLNNYFNTHLYNERGDTIPTKGFITNVLTDAALQFIRDNRDTSFFCYVPYNAPHSPFQAPDNYFRKYKRKGLTDKNAAIYGMLENVDHNVGRLLSLLDSLQIADNTIVVFLSDNGPNGVRYNGGMKGSKASVDEGGVRVPCFVRWPGQLPAGKEVPQLAAHIDLLPTLLDLAGIRITPVYPFDGRSLVPLMREDQPEWPDRALFTVYSEDEPRAYPGAMRTDRYRFLLNRDNQSELYDMQQDPGQTTDLSAQLPEVVDTLRQQYEAWYAGVTAQGYTVPLIPVGFPQELVTELPAPEARLSGAVSFKGGRGWANDYLVGWSSPADTAAWDIAPATIGHYEIIIEYTAKATAVGTRLEVNTGGYTRRTAIMAAYDPPFLPSPDRVKREEVYEKKWGRLSLGKVPMMKGQQTLTLSIDKQLPPDALEIKAVWLRLLPE